MMNMLNSREHILSRLSTATTPISGDMLAHELDISRSAVWKHITHLRKQGADIQSLQGKGYQLTSEIFNATTLAANLNSDGLAPTSIGNNILHFDSIDSTNHEAMRQAEKHCPEGTVIIANKQSQGRGRLGRTWHTIEGALAISMVLRPPLPPEDVPQLSLLTAVALQHALTPYCEQIHIKWPNDLLIHGEKVAGILTEMRAEPGLVHAVIVGIGINLHPPKQTWPEDIPQAVTDLQSHSEQAISRLDCAAAILKSMDTYYAMYLKEGFAPIREAWWQAHAASGQKVRVHDGKSYIDGIAQDLAEDGALLLATPNGVQRIIAGELELLEKT